MVVGTGDSTVIGGMAEELGEIEDEMTPIQWEVRRISRIMIIIIFVCIVLIFILGVLRGESVEEMLLTSIAIAVASIPEGLPAAVTIILAVGMEALLKRGGLVRNLLAAETLGSTTYILTDKTGTLTEARMAITDMLYEDSRGTSPKEGGDWKSDERAKHLLDIALCATDAFLDERKDEHEAYIVRGEPMERAILETAQDLGVTVVGESMRAHRADLLAFESKYRFAAGLAVLGDTKQLCINGAPELLLENATNIMKNGHTVHLSPTKRTFYEHAIRQYAHEGKRLIGVLPNCVLIKRPLRRR